MQQYKFCVIYANCQGEYLKKILSKSKIFTRIYTQIEHFENYKFINDKQIEYLKIYFSNDICNIILDYKYQPIPSYVCNADLFIYQPVNSNHNKLSTTHIINNILKKECKVISFPYIYNNAIWIYDKKGNFDKIFKNLFLNFSLEETLAKFKNLEIDFNFQKRFENTMNILKIREQTTDIKVHQYILDNFKKKKLFISEPHPTIHIYYHCTIQLFKLLNLNNDISFELAFTVLTLDRAQKLHTGLIEKFPKTPYDINFYKFEWKKEPDDNWLAFYSDKIKKIYLETLSMNN